MFILLTSIYGFGCVTKSGPCPAGISKIIIKPVSFKGGLKEEKEYFPLVLFRQFLNAGIYLKIPKLSLKTSVSLDNSYIVLESQNFYMNFCWEIDVYA